MFQLNVCLNFKTSTIGLVTLYEMKAKQEVIVQEREKQLAKKQREKEREIEQELEAKRAEKRKQKQQIQALSFRMDDEGEEDDDNNEMAEEGRDKEITSFLNLESIPNEGKYN